MEKKEVREDYIYPGRTLGQGLCAMTKLGWTDVVNHSELSSISQHEQPIENAERNAHVELIEFHFSVRLNISFYVPGVILGAC
jgi:hypothetical protein